MRLYYYKRKYDSGFVYRTVDLGCYIVNSNDFTGHQKRKVITTLPHVSDFFRYGDSLFEYNTKTNVIKPFMTDQVTDSAKVFMLPKASLYGPKLPYSNQLIRLNGEFGFIYNYTVKKQVFPSFVDTFPFIVTIDSIKNKRIGRYPPLYYKEEMRFDDTYLTVDKTGNIYYVHSGFDSVYKIDSKGQVICQNVLYNFPKRDSYKPAKKQDIAFVRKYEAMNEKNCNIRLCQNKHIVVIKQLAQLSVLDKPAYRFFIFNTSLEKLFVSDALTDIIPVVIENDKGFLLMDKNFKKIFCYELP